MSKIDLPCFHAQAGSTCSFSPSRSESQVPFSTACADPTGVIHEPFFFTQPYPDYREVLWILPKHILSTTASRFSHCCHANLNYHRLWPGQLQQTLLESASALLLLIINTEF